MDQLEPEATHLARCERMNEVLHLTFNDLVDAHLAHRYGDDNQHIGDRMYARLEALPVRDLALALVVAYDHIAEERAAEVWRALDNARWPEEAR